MDGSWFVETLPCGTGVKRCIVPVSLDAMALIIHLNTSPMDRTAPMVIFTTLHGDTGWLVAALFVWGFELDWSIFSDPIVHTCNSKKNIKKTTARSNLVLWNGKRCCRYISRAYHSSITTTAALYTSRGLCQPWVVDLICEI